MSPPNLPEFSWSVVPESIVVVPVKVPLRESLSVIPYPCKLNCPDPATAPSELAFTVVISNAPPLTVIK